jgi:hypothetical protein
MSGVEASEDIRDPAVNSSTRRRGDEENYAEKDKLD